MLHNNNIYILDAKYYKYGATKNPFDLPESASINKQITYGEYIDAQADLKNPDSVIYNAFLMPFDKNYWAEENAGALHYETLSVPEFAVTEYCDFILGNDNIRMAAAHLIILAVADALMPQGLAQEDFYFCILAADGLHILMALLLSQPVHNRCNAPR